jgi:hypothetical protein
VGASTWVYKANRYFSYYNTPAHQNILMASFHMEEEVLVWFQDVKESGVVTSW